jgi:NADH-quinone oxidoreductase subunit H
MTGSALLIESIAMLLKLVVGIAVGAQVAPIMNWVERRQCALIQRRVGPNRVGIFGTKLFGLGQPLADAVKLLFKEDFVPKHVNKYYYLLAPIIPALIGLVSVQAIPFGKFVIVGEQIIKMQAISLNAGYLVIFAVSALGVYGVALAGWSSNNKYALLGSLRASAQMVSYEISMAMSLLPIVLVFGSLDLQMIVAEQSNSLLFGFLPNWGVFYAPISFCIFLVAILAETNRVPFDLSEGEAELVAGFLVEYGAMRWSLFFLGEYAMLFTLSALTVCLFFGGYEIPYFPQEQMVQLFAEHTSNELALWLAFGAGFATLIAKVAILMIVFVQVRFTIPRFRYDQLMKVGWTFMFPLALANVAVSALIVAYFKFRG